MVTRQRALRRSLRRPSTDQAAESSKPSARNGRAARPVGRRLGNSPSSADSECSHAHPGSFADSSLTLSAYGPFLLSAYGPFLGLPVLNLTEFSTTNGMGLAR